MFAINWAIPFSVLGLVGTLYCLALAIPSILQPNTLLSQQAALVGILAMGFYAPIFFCLHRIAIPYYAGYWLPRLIMPPLVVFLVLGFLILEFSIERASFSPRTQNIIKNISLAYTSIACLLFIAFLT
jgi:hypothetical protein